MERLTLENLTNRGEEVTASVKNRLGVIRYFFTQHTKILPTLTRTVTLSPYK
jgi:hypothetical protein